MSRDTTTRLARTLVWLEEKYLHKDHLSSIVAITREDGSIGRRRNASAWNDESIDPSSLETDCGFSGHEMLDNIDLDLIP